MAIRGKLIIIDTKKTYDSRLGKGDIPSSSIVFIKDTGQIITHGKEFGGKFGTANNQYVPVVFGNITKNLSLSSHTHSNYVQFTHKDDKSISLDWGAQYNNNTAAYLLAWNADGTKIKSITKDNLKVGYAKKADIAESVNEANVNWGGKNFVSDNGCIDACLIPELGANRFAYANPEGISIEYSTDSGITWKTYNASDAEKLALTSQGGSITLSRLTGRTCTSQDQMRITFKTKDCHVYTELHKFALFISTMGSRGSTCSIDIALESTPTDYVNIVNNQRIEGWSGWNIINVPKFTTFGNRPSQQYGRIRFTFKQQGNIYEEYLGLQVYKIQAFGGFGWETPSNLAKTGDLYSYNSAQNANFPGSVRATRFVGPADTAVKLHYSRTINGVIFDGTKNITITADPNSHTHSYTQLTGSSTIANQVICSTGTANQWTLKTLGSNAFNSTAYMPINNLLSTDVRSGGQTTSRYVNRRGQILINSVDSDTYFYLKTNYDLKADHIYTIGCRASGVGTSGVYYKFGVFGQNSKQFLTINKDGYNYAIVKCSTNISAGSFFILDDYARNCTNQRDSIILTDFTLVDGSTNTGWMFSDMDIALHSEIPTKLSQLTNDKGYITGYTNNYLTGISGSGNGVVTFTRSGLSNLTWNASHTHSGYLTSHQKTFSKIKIGTQTIEADIAQDTLTIEAGDNITITPDTTNDKIKISTPNITVNKINSGSFVKSIVQDGHSINVTYATPPVYNYYLTGVTGSGNGTVTFTRKDLTSLTWNSTHSHTLADCSGNLSISRISGDIPASRISGIINIDNLPHAALERLVIVQNDTQRLALTSTKIQNGDTVKVTDTGKMYFVKNDSLLGTASKESAFEEYTVGYAASVPWAGISGKPGTFTPSSHRHNWSEIDSKPAQATRWPSLSEVTGSDVVCTSSNSSVSVNGNTLTVKIHGTEKSLTNTTYNLVGTLNTTGLIKNGSSITNVSGYIACPIKDGIPYYKNNTYSLSSFGLSVTATELNYCSGVTSNIQDQLNTKSNSNHSHNYLPLTGGTLLGPLTLKKNTWNSIGNQVLIGGFENSAGSLSIKAVTPSISFYNSQNAKIGSLKCTTEGLVWDIQSKNYALLTSNNLKTINNQSLVGIGNISIEGIGKLYGNNNGEIFNDYAHNVASGISSHAEGINTIATNPGEHACGTYNKSNTNTIFSVGVGTASERKNAFEIIKDGDFKFKSTNSYGRLCFEDDKYLSWDSDGFTLNFPENQQLSVLGNMFVNGNISTNDVVIGGTSVNRTFTEFGREKHRFHIGATRIHRYATGETSINCMPDGTIENYLLVKNSLDQSPTFDLKLPDIEPQMIGKQITVYKPYGVGVQIQHANGPYNCYIVSMSNIESIDGISRDSSSADLNFGLNYAGYINIIAFPPHFHSSKFIWLIYRNVYSF